MILTVMNAIYATAYGSLKNSGLQQGFINFTNMELPNMEFTHKINYHQFNTGTTQTEKRGNYITVITLIICS